MNNYKLRIQYDGTDYAGWQIQKGSYTVQQKITDAAEIILKNKINLIGSGRTDAGVHALGQVANFKFEQDIDIRKFLHSMNAVLPYDISITGCEKVEENFHSRFDAKKRRYVYLFSRIKSPFYRRYSYYYHGELNCETLNRLSSVLLGEHDFTSFSRKKSETKNKKCNVFEAAWKERGELVIFTMEADRFLHGMVRTTVGTLLKAFKNNFNEDRITGILSEKERESAGEAVPPQGLFLHKVTY